jgi:ABC-type multidrug transport system ATPase subunit
MRRANIWYLQRLALFLLPQIDKFCSSSGLDSASAIKVMQVLRNLTIHQGTTIITTIHQPSSRIYSLFDSVLVLAIEGREMYYGSAKSAMNVLSQQGYPCPDGFNPADRTLSVSRSSLSARLIHYRMNQIYSKLRLILTSC